MRSFFFFVLSPSLFVCFPRSCHTAQEMKAGEAWSIRHGTPFEAIMGYRPDIPRLHLLCSIIWKTMPVFSVPLLRL
jgi:hypothetical protein